MDDDTHSGATVQEPSATFLTPKDVMQELKIGEKLAYRLIADGTIPSVRIGGVYRIHRKQLEEALLTNSSLEKSA